MDAAGEGKAPVFDLNPSLSIYWVLFIFVATFCIVQLFVGVIIDNYNREMSVLTEEQKKWVLLRRVLSKMGPEKLGPPENQVRLWVYRIVRSREFDVIIMALVLLNVAFMATNYYGVKDTVWGDCLVYINWIFVVLFALEAVAKIFAFG